MKHVSRFEANLLRIVHGILQRTPLEQVLPVVTKPLARPTCLSKEAVELVQDALAKGTVWLLARAGWRRERHVRAAQVREGRLWQRTPPPELGLAFSPHSLDFLMWLTTWGPKEQDLPPSPLAGEITVGDRLLFSLTYRLLRRTDAGGVLRQFGCIAGDGLCRLMFPDDLAEGTPATSVDWVPWTDGVGSCILEAFQAALAQRWIEMELHKGSIRSAERMLALGRSQEQTLQSFLAAVHAVGRWDLARFLLRAARAVLAGTPTAQAWVGGLDLKGLRLGERVDSQRAALALLRQLGELQKWDTQARTVGYFDEGYAASQLWKADWETHQGDELCRRAQLVLREIEPLKA